MPLQKIALAGKRKSEQILLLRVARSVCMFLLQFPKMVILCIRDILTSLILYKNIKLYLSNHLTIGIWNLYKKGTKFPHPTGIVVGMKVQIGSNCIIYQNVTIGAKDTVNYKTAKYPQIGNNVTIFPNSIIIGDVIIGDNAIIGTGAIVLKDVPANKIAFGNPAKIK